MKRLSICIDNSSQCYIFSTFFGPIRLMEQFFCSDIRITSEWITSW